MSRLLNENLEFGRALSFKSEEFARINRRYAVGHFEEEAASSSVLLARILEGIYESSAEIGFSSPRFVDVAGGRGLGKHRGEF